MKTLREELIDFVKWQLKNHMPHPSEIDELVDNYLKSINSNAPTESRNVATHEHQEKDCGTCLHKHVCSYKHPCNKCDRFSRWEQSV